MMMTPENVTVIINAFNRMAEQLRPVLENVGKLMRQWFPIVSEYHRAEVKRVHTAYDKRRRSRKRRK